MTINIQVLFPKAGLQNPGRLVANLPWFSHTFGDLAPYMTFDRVYVEGAGYPIIAKAGHIKHLKTRLTLRNLCSL